MTIKTRQIAQGSPQLVDYSVERMVIAAMEQAFLSERPCFVVQSRSAKRFVEVMFADDFIPLPDLQILFVAWPPEWRYGLRTQV